MWRGPQASFSCAKDYLSREARLRLLSCNAVREKRRRQGTWLVRVEIAEQKINKECFDPSHFAINPIMTDRPRRLFGSTNCCLQRVMLLASTADSSNTHGTVNKLQVFCCPLWYVGSTYTLVNLKVGYIN